MKTNRYPIILVLLILCSCSNKTSSTGTFLYVQDSVHPENLGKISFSEEPIYNEKFESDSTMYFGYEEEESFFVEEVESSEISLEETNYTTIPNYELDKNDTNSLTMSADINLCQMPNQISDLSGGTEIEITRYNNQQQASLTAMGFKTEITSRQQVIIKDFTRIDNIICDGKLVKIGIGLRCYIHVTNTNGRLNLQTISLPSLAANVELGQAQCTYRLKAMGFAIDGRQLTDLVTLSGDYTVENFGKIESAFGLILETLNADNTMKIKPVILPE